MKGPCTEVQCRFGPISPTASLEPFIQAESANHSGTWMFLRTVSAALEYRL